MKNLVFMYSLCVIVKKNLFDFIEIFKNILLMNKWIYFETNYFMHHDSDRKIQYYTIPIKYVQ